MEVKGGKIHCRHLQIVYAQELIHCALCFEKPLYVLRETRSGVELH